jgi:hypothetical protein
MAKGSHMTVWHFFACQTEMLCWVPGGSFLQAEYLRDSPRVSLAILYQCGVEKESGLGWSQWFVDGGLVVTCGVFVQEGNW